ncbi:hypothetical protein EDD18DRAFT_1118107 [Armillaria luteobubalina]|uniref:Uncharacterized protein n=1 Tax=Armillaria luteobubalina TaxID=153913 RepID=A0AA39NVV6_9AGAR|nr:hypothetical protein EDD18DRAFT_1118107 [Armillaria luteobubalina]
MSLHLYFLCAGLQAQDPFFSNPKQIYVHSASINNDFLAKVLLEAERSSGWHSLLPNPCNHYTLWGYNRAGWMSVTVEMECGNRGQSNLRAKHFFDPADHVEVESLDFVNTYCLRSVETCHIVSFILNQRWEDIDKPFGFNIYRTVSSIQESSYSLLYMVFLRFDIARLPNSRSDISMTLKQPVTMPTVPSPLLMNVGPPPATINKHSYQLHLWHGDLKWKEACKTQLDSHQMGPKAPFFTITPVQDLIYSSGPS